MTRVTIETSDRGSVDRLTQGIVDESGYALDLVDVTRALERFEREKPTIKMSVDSEPVVVHNLRDRFCEQRHSVAGHPPDWETSATCRACERKRIANFESPAPVTTEVNRISYRGPALLYLTGGDPETTYVLGEAGLELGRIERAVLIARLRATADVLESEAGQ